jgi:multiple sugar transport system substrate-binding protein
MNEDYKKQKNVTVESEIIPQGVDATAKMVAALHAGGTSYDFVRVDVIDLALYAVSNWIEDVTSRVPRDLQEDIIPFAKQAVTYKGKWYGMPKDSEWKTWVYNEKKLTAAGISKPPETWDEYVEASKAIISKTQAKFGQTWGWKQGENLVCDYPAIVKSFGGEVMTENLDLVVNQGGGVDALQAMVNWLQKDKIVDPASLNGSNTEARNPQAAGDTAFGLHWGTPVAVFNDASKSKVVGETKAGLMPHKAGVASWTVSGPECWAISKGSQYKDQTWDYLIYRQGKDGAKRQFLGEGSVFAWKSLYDDPETQAFAKKSQIDFEVSRKQSENIVNRPMIPWYYDYSAALQLEVSNALTQKKTPKQALDDAVAAYVKIKQKAGG